MPLTEAVVFTTRLQKGNRIQVPKPIRWRFKLEPTQVLKVTVHATHLWGSWQSFYARIDTSGRITVPKLVCDELIDSEDEQRRLIGAVLQVKIEPA